MQCQPQRQNDEWFCATCKRRWSTDDKPAQCFLHLEENVPVAASPPSDDLRMRLALAINGPYDARFVGPEKLKELQRVRWERQTTDADKKRAYQSAGAVLDVLREQGIDL